MERRDATVVRVLQPFRTIRPTTNPYIVMLHQQLSSTPGIEAVMFSYRRALLGRYDVVHLHWPETLLGGRTRLRRLARTMLAHLFLLRLTLFRVPLVRTVHNLGLPDGLWPLERWYLSGLERLTSLRIYLNDTTRNEYQPASSGAGAVDVTIPHGHYRNWYADFPVSAALPGRIGFVGLIRRYKNASGLVKAFHQALDVDPMLTLRIAGSPSSDELRNELVGLTRGHESIELDLRFLEEAEVVSAISSSEIIALPYLHMHNSGAALAALSLDRPVLVPASDAARALQDEVGAGWVILFEPPVGGSDLLDAVVRSRGDRSARPDLSRRGWADAGRQHLAAYRQAVAERRSGSRSCGAVRS